MRDQSIWGTCQKKSRLLIVKSMSQLVKNLPTMRETICNTGDAGSTAGLGRSPGEGNGTPPKYSCLAWRIPWAEEPGRLQSRESEESDVT